MSLVVLLLFYQKMSDKELKILIRATLTVNKILEP